MHRIIKISAAIEFTRLYFGFHGRSTWIRPKIVTSVCFRLYSAFKNSTYRSLSFFLAESIVFGKVLSFKARRCRVNGSATQSTQVAPIPMSTNKELPRAFVLKEKEKAEFPGLRFTSGYLAYSFKTYKFDKKTQNFVLFWFRSKVISNTSW